MGNQTGFVMPSSDGEQIILPENLATPMSVFVRKTVNNEDHT